MSPRRRAFKFSAVPPKGMNLTGRPSASLAIIDVTCKVPSEGCDAPLNRVALRQGNDFIPVLRSRFPRHQEAGHFIQTNQIGQVSNVVILLLQIFLGQKGSGQGADGIPVGWSIEENAESLFRRHLLASFLIRIAPAFRLWRKLLEILFQKGRDGPCGEIVAPCRFKGDDPRDVSWKDRHPRPQETMGRTQNEQSDEADPFEEASPVNTSS